MQNRANVQDIKGTAKATEMTSLLGGQLFNRHSINGDCCDVVVPAQPVLPPEVLHQIASYLAIMEELTKLSGRDRGNNPKLDSLRDVAHLSQVNKYTRESIQSAPVFFKRADPFLGTTYEKGKTFSEESSKLHRYAEQVKKYKKRCEEVEEAIENRDAEENRVWTDRAACLGATTLLCCLVGVVPGACGLGMYIEATTTANLAGGAAELAHGVILGSVGAGMMSIGCGTGTLFAYDQVKKCIARHPNVDVGPAPAMTMSRSK